MLQIVVEKSRETLKIFWNQDADQKIIVPNTEPHKVVPILQNWFIYTARLHMEN
jgi:hypothetical protein